MILGISHKRDQWEVSQAPHFWAGVGGAVVIRCCAHPAVHLRPADVEKVLVFLNAMSVGILTKRYSGRT